MAMETGRFWNWRRFGRLFVIGVLGASVVGVLLTAPIWVEATFAGVPIWLRRRIASLFLKGLLVGYFVALVAVGTATTLAFGRAHRAKRRREPRPAWVARTLAFAVVYLVSLAVVESSSAFYTVWNRELPPPPQPPPGSELVPNAEGGPTTPRDNSLYLVVLGESSARGEPYHPWLSVGQILGWELESIFPGREVEVDIWAEGGVPLKPNHRILFQEINRRPDAVLIYSGHNEFQARFPWQRTIPYYADDMIVHPRTAILSALGHLTPLCRLIHDTIELHSLSTPPPPLITRELVDRPVCSRAETEQILDEFRRRLESMVAYCNRMGSVPILVIPAGNDAGFEPGRSVLSPSTRVAQRGVFATEFEKARAEEARDPVRAAALYKTLLVQQPTFSEAHFRLARLLESRRDYEAAGRHYIAARDLDGMPMRCPSAIQAIYRDVAARHRAVLVDGQLILSGMSPTGILDGRLFHDGQHPTLTSYVALAQVALDQLKERKAFGWPTETPAPLIDPDVCAQRAGLNSERWAAVCDRTAHFFKLLAYSRYDPTERLELTARWEKATEAVRTGTPPQDLGMPGLGTHPEGVRPLDRDRYRKSKGDRIQANTKEPVNVAR
jgi:hypothetical protein